MYHNGEAFRKAATMESRFNVVAMTISAITVAAIIKTVRIPKRTRRTGSSSAEGTASTTACRVSCSAFLTIRDSARVAEGSRSEERRVGKGCGGGGAAGEA